MQCFVSLTGMAGSVLKTSHVIYPSLIFTLRFQNRLLEMGVMLFGQISFLLFIFWTVSHEALPIYILDWLNSWSVPAAIVVSSCAAALWKQRWRWWPAGCMTTSTKQEVMACMQTWLTMHPSTQSARLFSTSSVSAVSSCWNRTEVGSRDFSRCRTFFRPLLFWRLLCTCMALSAGVSGRKVCILYR